MAVQGSIDKQIKKYCERIEFLENAYKDEKYRKILDDRLAQKHPAKYTDFGEWIKEVKKQYIYDLTQRGDKLNGYNFLHFDKCDITTFYNDIKELQGEKKTYSRMVYDSIKNWDKPYLKRKVSIPAEKDYDFYSVDVTYYFRSTLKPEEARELIKTNKKQFASDSLDAAFERLQGNKKYKNVRKEFLQIKKVVYRSKFKELRITIGLKDTILKLKEEMQEEINEDLI